MVHIHHFCYTMTINKRAEESKQMISEAFIRLLQNEDFSLITITQICQEAQICRNTFYRNFSSKDDIMSYLIENITRKINEQTMAFVTADMSETELFEHIYRTFFSYWQKERALLSAVITHNLYVLFSAQFFSYLSDYIILLEKRFSETTLEFHQDYLRNSISSMMTSLLMTWAQHDFQESLDEIVAISMHLQHLHFTICNNTVLLEKREPHKS